MAARSLKALARKKDLKVGAFHIEFDTPGIGHIVKNAGADFTILDLEHSGFGIETARRVLPYMRVAELPTICRAPSKDYKDIARLCDVGAEGIMVPMVNNVDEAKSIIEAMKYVPRGKRGVILRAANDGFTAGPTLPKLRSANARTFLVTQIETAEGVENAEAIASLKDVDILWIGHFDLSCSLGIPGEFDNPKFTKAVERVVAAGKKTATSLGRLVPDVASGVTLHRQGFDFIAYSADAWVLGDALAAAFQGLKGGKK